jgi:hypothetical protein
MVFRFAIITGELEGAIGRAPGSFSQKLKTKDPNG